MFWLLTTLSFAQEPQRIIGVSPNSQGIECIFTEPFITFRYNFQTKIMSRYGMDLPFKLYSVEMTTKQTTNPFAPQYQLIEKGTSKNKLSIIFDNQGSDGMSDEHFYQLSARYNDRIVGGCFFVNYFGTHAVVGTYNEDEPWLNLRSENSVKSDVIKKLYDGMEVNILKVSKGWANVQVVSHQGEGATGWVSTRYIRKIAVPSVK